MTIYSTENSAFSRYGRRLSLDTRELLAAADSIEMPQEGSVYTASEEKFEALQIAGQISRECFGGLATQLGYCRGRNRVLNALEWHSCSEVNVATQPLLLLLGDRRDITPDGRFSTADVQAFQLQRGEAVEIFATTLHFCPIEIGSQGFGCVVGLCAGTNLPLTFKPQDRLLFAENKWLIAHEEAAALQKRGAVVGLYGKQLCF